MDTSRATAQLAPIFEIGGKVLIAALFWWSGVLEGVMTWPDAAAYVAFKGFPVPHLVAGAAIVAEILLPAALFVRRFESVAAFLLAGYCLLTALFFHDYWTLDSADRIEQQINFFKNLSIAGALLVIVARNHERTG